MQVHLGSCQKTLEVLSYAQAKIHLIGKNKSTIWSGYPTPENNPNRLYGPLICVLFMYKVE